MNSQPPRTPRTRRNSSLFLLCVLSVLCGLNPIIAQSKSIDFDTEIMPVISRMGCNAGACHGAAVGRGGFRLSLFGSDPENDFANIVHELKGRRVNLAKPDESLLLLKPTSQIDHGGGYRFGIDDEAGKRLRQWINEGAHRSKSPARLTQLAITPLVQSFKKRDESVALKAMATFSDGRVNDVSEWMIWQSNDPSAVEIADGRATIRRPGQHMVMARYLDRIVPIRLALPFENVAAIVDRATTNNFIDERINQTLAALHLPASERCDDAAFMRRVRLDLTGRLPDLLELQAFVANRSADKRSALIDHLLNSEDFVEYWTFQLATLFRNRPMPGEMAGAVAFHEWLKQQLKTHRGMDAMARDIVTATGDTHRHGPAWFWRLSNDARAQAEVIGQAFLGVRLQCANCHNHPLDRWTQDDYHGLSAMLVRLERGRSIMPSERGGVTNPRTGELAVAQFPGVLIEGQKDLRKPLADWLTKPDNPYFAKAVVNRLWKSMFGRGLVEPVDDMRETNPATHPEHLDQLAKDFVAHGYDVRHTLRLIANSATYNRSSATTSANRDDDRFYSHSFERSLPPEVLADAWADITAVFDQYSNAPLGTRSISLVDPATPSRTLDLLGRCSRKEPCESEPMNGGLPAMLQKINGEAVNRKLHAETGRLHRLMAEVQSNDAIVDEFYLRALSRMPTEKERKLLTVPAGAKRSEWLEDVMWALLNSREFTTNH